MSHEYNDEYETCSRTYVELCIYTECGSQTVTDALGMMPTKADDTRNLWTLSSERYVRSFDFRRHLDWLLDRLESRATALRELQTEQGVTMFARSAWWSKYSDGGPMLWPEQLGRLAALGLRLRFDVTFSTTTF